MCRDLIGNPLTDLFSSPRESASELSLPESELESNVRKLKLISSEFHDRQYKLPGIAGQVSSLANRCHYWPLCYGMMKLLSMKFNARHTFQMASDQTAKLFC